MYDPTSDLKQLYKLFHGSSDLLAALGWTSGDKGKFLQPQKYSGQQLSGKVLFFTFAPMQSSRNDLCVRMILQTEAHVPNKANASYDAWDILKEVRILLHCQIVNGHEIVMIPGEGQVASAPGYIGVSNRYRYPLVI